MRERGDVGHTAPPAGRGSKRGVLRVPHAIVKVLLLKSVGAVVAANRRFAATTVVQVNA